MPSCAPTSSRFEPGFVARRRASAWARVTRRTRESSGVESFLCAFEDKSHFLPRTLERGLNGQSDKRSKSLAKDPGDASCGCQSAWPRNERPAFESARSTRSARRSTSIWSG